MCKKLGQVLFTVLNDAKVNIWDSSTHTSLLKQLTHITNAFYDDQKLIAKDIPFKKCYRYLLNESTLAQAQTFLQKAHYWFPKTLTPFVIFTSIVTKITCNNFVTKKEGKTFEVSNKIFITSNWINLDKSAPYFLATAAILNQDNKIVLKDAFAIPVFSSQLLIPVESNYERTILKIILIKPLFNLISSSKNTYRPDFIIMYNNLQIFIEVLGSNNPGYLMHKNRINQIAQDECDRFISVKAFDLQNNYDLFVSELKEALKS